MLVDWYCNAHGLYLGTVAKWCGDARSTRPDETRNMKTNQNKKPKLKWRLLVEHKGPNDGKLVTEEHHYATHDAAMRALRRQLLVLWRAKVTDYRMGVNHLRSSPWKAMSHELSDGMFVPDSMLGRIREIKQGLHSVLAQLEMATPRQP